MKPTAYNLAPRYTQELKELRRIRIEALLADRCVFPKINEIGTRTPSLLIEDIYKYPEVDRSLTPNITLLKRCLEDLGFTMYRKRDGFHILYSNTNGDKYMHHNNNESFLTKYFY